jgi:hypothetical protein
LNEDDEVSATSEPISLSVPTSLALRLTWMITAGASIATRAELRLSAGAWMWLRGVQAGRSGLPKVHKFACSPR